MKKSILFLLLLNFLVAKSQVGYLGKVHNFGLGTSFNPIALSYHILGDDWFESGELIYSSVKIRPFYEYIYSKTGSIHADFGFHNISIGSIQTESNLFTTNDQISYVQGFDVGLSFRFHSYKKRGRIAPIGIYRGFKFGLPVVNHHINKNESELGTTFYVGIESGIRKIISSKFTADFGFNAAMPTEVIAPFAIARYNEEDFEYIAAGIATAYNNVFQSINIYIKLGLLK